MNPGEVGRIALMAFVTIAFSIGAFRGLRKERVWLPDDGTDLIDPMPTEVAPQYRRLAGAAFLLFAIGSLIFTLILIRRFMRGV